MRPSVCAPGRAAWAPIRTADQAHVADPVQDMLSDEDIGWPKG